MQESLKSLFTRVEGLEEQNALFKLDNQQLKAANQQQDIKRLTQENERLSRANAALEQRVERLEAVKSQQTAALNPSSDVDNRAQFTAFACTSEIVSMSCPKGRTILTTFAVYGRHDYTCGDCCAPNPQFDCSEIMEESRPSDWQAIQELCDGQTSCQFENLGIASMTSCLRRPSEYMQLFYSCLPDDETGPVAFSAWANTASSASYSINDIIVFNEILTNAGGHYNAATSSFICPWDGIYLMSVNIESQSSNGIHVNLMQNDVMLANMNVDDIQGAFNRGSTTVVTECNRGDIVWVRAETNGTLYARDQRNVLTCHLLHRFDVNTAVQPSTTAFSVTSPVTSKASLRSAHKLRCLPNSMLLLGAIVLFIVT